jgi:hypothetical protein
MDHHNRITTIAENEIRRFKIGRSETTPTNTKTDQIPGNSRGEPLLPMIFFPEIIPNICLQI